MISIYRAIIARLGVPKFHREHTRSPRLGLITWVYIGSAIALGYAAPQFNQWFFPWLVSPLDKSSISTILATIASGMITLTGIVFSLVFVIVQFGSSTYSPRITRVFAHVRSLRHSLGIFTGTFIYCLMALRTLGLERGEIVSAFTVWLAFAWLLASVVILANLVRVFTTLTIGNVLFALSTAGRFSIARLYTPLTAGNTNRASGGEGQTLPELPIAQTVLYKGAPGYVIRYDTRRLMELARPAGQVIHLPYAVGDALRDGEAVAQIRGGETEIPEPKIYSAIILGRERAFRDDPRYALRLLVDMAIRALSPAINDPTTAVQALDHIELLLHRLGNSDLDIGTVRDREGRVRVVYAAPGWEVLLRLGLSEIMQYGATSLQVQRRLAALLQFLSRAVPPDRAAVVEQFAKEREVFISSAWEDDTLRQWAETPDHSGLGGGGDI
ncbi:DUF2254 domain-containing protein [Thiohalomonas denitrificans]|uniref:DUF2254 domain-containing protein n=1 Tax=Thiohalomonas denitrificans TaxID=415747 RepID=UPI0026F23733|nr:DUF2254 domain-containing protein [Thiohalomonas denitrificans]